MKEPVVLALPSFSNFQIFKLNYFFKESTVVLRAFETLSI